MDKFLEELKEALENAKVENKDEILATYLEHFALGHEAGMTDEEIIERFDSIEKIVHQYKQPEEGNHHKENSLAYNISLELTWFSDFSIRKSNKITGIQFDIDEKALEYVDIIREGKNISLKTKSFNFNTKKKNFDGEMLVGLDTEINRFVISNVNGDVNMNLDIQCNTFSLSNINGDVTNVDVHAEESITISNTNGDINFKRFEAPKVKISNVSGDLHINEFVADQVKISTISGDVTIKQSNSAEFQINSVSGDVCIDGGIDPSKVKGSTVSGNISVDGVSIAKTISDLFKNSFKW